MNADGRGRHLQERQRARVVPRRVALHGGDLQRLEDGVREDECVPERGSAGNAVQKQKSDDGEPDAEPQRARHGRSEEGEREQWREHDVEAGDEAGARHGRELEAGRLEAVCGGEQRADADADDVSPTR